MDSQERAYVRGGQSAVRTAFGVITNYAKDPSFEGSGAARTIMRNIAAYGSFEHVQPGTTEVRRNLMANTRGNTMTGWAAQNSSVQMIATGGPEGIPTFFRMTPTVTNGTWFRVWGSGSAVRGVVIPGATYMFSYYIRTNRVITARVGGFEQSAAGGNLKESSIQSTVQPSSEWTRVSGLITMRADTYLFAPYAMMTDSISSDVVEITGFMMEQTDQLRPYFDGNSANEKGFTTEFGTAGTSSGIPSIMRATTLTVRENFAGSPMGSAAAPAGRLAIARFANAEYVNGWNEFAVTDANTGTQAQRIQQAAAQDRGMPVSAGETVTLSLEVAAGTNWRSRVAIGITYTDSTGATVGGIQLPSPFTPLVPSSSGQVLSYTFTVPSTAGIANAGWSVFRNDGDVSVGDRLRVRNVLFERGSALGAFFEGSSPSYGDSINGWSGAVNASTSVQQYVALHTSTGNRASGNAYYSWDWTAVGGSMRYFPTSSSATNSYYNPSVSNRLAAGTTYTAAVRLRITAPSAGYRALELRTSTGSTIASSGQAPNEPGEYILRMVFTPNASSNYMRMETRGDAGWSSWWADLTVVEGNYPDLMPFDGSSVAQAPYYYAWESTPFASDSIYAAPGVSNITGGAQVTRPNGSKALLVAKGETATLDAAYFGMPSIVGFSSVISLEVAPYYAVAGGNSATQIDAGTLLGRLTMDNGDVVELRNDEAIVAFATASGSNNSSQRVGWTMSIPSNRSVSSFQLMAPSNGNYSGILFDRLLVSRLQPQLL